MECLSYTVVPPLSVVFLSVVSTACDQPRSRSGQLERSAVAWCYIPEPASFPSFLVILRHLTISHRHRKGAYSTMRYFKRSPSYNFITLHCCSYSVSRCVVHLSLCLTDKLNFILGVDRQEKTWYIGFSVSTVPGIHRVGVGSLGSKPPWIRRDCGAVLVSFRIIAEAGIPHILSTNSPILDNNQRAVLVPLELQTSY